MPVTTFKYRLYPTVCHHWYNMCVEDRKLVRELEKRHISKSAQSEIGIRYRQAFPNWICFGGLSNSLARIDRLVADDVYDAEMSRP